MLIEFRLTMPNVGSWNGKWTGESNYYAVVRMFTKNDAEKTDRILKEKSYYYNFGDGWGADVSIRIVDSKESARIRKISKGFQRYDWMIDSILRYNEILNTNQRKEREG